MSTNYQEERYGENFNYAYCDKSYSPEEFLVLCKDKPELFYLFRLTTQISTSRELNRVSPNNIAETAGMLLAIFVHKNYEAASAWFVSIFITVCYFADYSNSYKTAVNNNKQQTIMETKVFKDKVTLEDVKANMQDVIVRTLEDFGKPCTYVTVRMKNGFTLRESTTCVDPDNYNEEIGKQVCLKRIEDKIWLLLGYSLQTELSAKNRVLASTRDMMISPDYKERFKAEYVQLKNRFDGLKKMLDVWDDGKLNFKPTCPRDLYVEQSADMALYLRTLERRAKLEGIDLTDAQ